MSDEDKGRERKLTQMNLPPMALVVTSGGAAMVREEEPEGRFTSTKNRLLYYSVKVSLRYIEMPPGKPTSRSQSGAIRSPEFPSTRALHLTRK